MLSGGAGEALPDITQCQARGRAVDEDLCSGTPLQLEMSGSRPLIDHKDIFS